jgi:hypothetical protein
LRFICFLLTLENEEYFDLIEKSRKILNDKLNDEIKKTENSIFRIFFDNLNIDTKNYKEIIESLNIEQNEL